MKVKTFKTKETTWVDVSHPSKKKLLKLGKAFKLEPLCIQECLTEIQRPQIEKHRKYLFIILRFPVYVKKERRFLFSEIDIFFKKKFLFTIHNGKIQPVLNFISEVNSSPEKKEEYLKSAEFLIYSFLKRLFVSQFPLTKYLSEEIDHIEENIFQGKEKEQVREISIVGRNIIDFRKIIKPQREITKQLLRSKHFFSKEFSSLYLDDLKDYVERIWHILENEKETLQHLKETNESLISHKTTEIMKILTIFSVVLLPSTLIASLFSMNIAFFPMAEHPAFFWIILAVMISLSVGMIYFFKQKKWF